VIEIVIPFLRRDLYPQCIQSIAANTEAGTYTIYLVDDSSGILGPVKAYNKGIQQTHGDIIVLMNDDIIVTPDWIENMLSVDADVVVSLYQNESFYPNISCTLIRRYVIERVGLLDERWFLGFGADNDWFIRMEHCGFRIGVNQKNRIIHEHRASIQRVVNYRTIAENEQKMFLKKHMRR
jgi:GT2 family glycosyltransferase